jgi:hypothetical protein
MSARSGIVVSEQLSRAFAAALDNHQVRFIKASISNGHFSAKAIRDRSLLTS